MKKEELKLELFDTNQSVLLVGLRFMVYTTKRLFEHDPRLNWDLNVTTLMTILNRMSPEDELMRIFNDFQTTVEQEQIDQWKSEFIQVYNELMDEIKPTGIIALIGDGFNDEVDDFVYGNDILF